MPARRALRVNGKGNPNYWTHPPATDKALVDRFRSYAKKHYFMGQLRRCCYCSYELSNHQGTYDAEHVLHRKCYPQFMFELSNLSVACKPCNGSKGTKPVLKDSVVVGPTMPATSNDFKVVHPHLDEWGHHLRFDKIGRIVVHANSEKGRDTISMCGITAVNAARLSDHFFPAGTEAEEALRGFFRVESVAWKKKYVGILDKLATDYKLAPAVAIVKRLRSEV